jgi:hypothetical protein
MSRNFIKGAIKRPGAFRAAAARRGISTAELRRRVKANPERYPTRLRRQAALASTLAKLRR